MLYVFEVHIDKRSSFFLSFFCRVTMAHTSLSLSLYLSLSLSLSFSLWKLTRNSDKHILSLRYRSSPVNLPDMMKQNYLWPMMKQKERAEPVDTFTDSPVQIHLPIQPTVIHTMLLSHSRTTRTFIHYVQLHTLGHSKEAPVKKPTISKLALFNGQKINIKSKDCFKMPKWFYINWIWIQE